MSSGQSERYATRQRERCQNCNEHYSLRDGLCWQCLTACTSVRMARRDAREHKESREHGND